VKNAHAVLAVYIMAFLHFRNIFCMCLIVLSYNKYYLFDYFLIKRLDFNSFNSETLVQMFKQNYLNFLSKYIIFNQNEMVEKNKVY